VIFQKENTTRTRENDIYVFILMKIIFFGTPEFAIPSLKKLIEAGFNIAAVVTTPDEPTGRKGTLTPPPVKIFAEKNGLMFSQPTLLSDDRFFEEFKGLEPDVCIVVAYGKLIPKRYLEVPKYGFINIHPSLLPKYRGPSPIQSAILNGDSATGVSIMIIDEKMDHGPILKQIEYVISKDGYFYDTQKELADIGANLLLETLPEYLNGKIIPRKQNDGQATYVGMLDRHHGRIDWAKSAESIYNQVRALSLNPGTWTTLNGKTLNIFRAEMVELASYDKIIREKNRLLIRASNNYISPTVLQLEGKKILPIKDFLNGLGDDNIIIA